MRHPGRRTDIQGLRALAVGLVVLEHVTGVPKSGFIGVDVFFVISGFLITGLLLREHAATGRVQLQQFFLRRIRRLMPAAAVVLAVSVAVAWAVLPSGRIHAVLTDAGWSAVSLGNWHFAMQRTDYFDRDSLPSPFLHFWSLSVEEQFFLVTPIALAASLGVGSIRVGRRIAFATMSATTVTSLIVGVVLTDSDPSGAYFSTAVRAWEFGAGALLAFAQPSLRRWSPRWAQVATWAGLGVIVTAAVVLPPDRGFPAPLALVPVLGTALVLAGGTRRSTRPVVILRLRLVQFVGDRSYSLYLWHFPVFVLLSWTIPGGAWLAIPLSLALATITFGLVEEPCTTMPWSATRWQSSNRDRTRWRRWAAAHRGPLRRHGIAALVLVSVVLVTAAGAGVRPVDRPVTGLPVSGGGAADDTTPEDQQGEPDAPAGSLDARRQAIISARAATTWPTLTPSLETVNEPEYLRRLVSDSAWNDVLGCSKPGTDRSLDSCTFGDPNGRLAVLVGDSTAAFSMPAYRRMVSEPDSGWRVLDLARTACPFTAADLVFAEDDSCAAHKERVVETIRELHPDLVLITNTSSSVKDRAGKPVSDADWAHDVSTITGRFREVAGQTAIVLPNPSGPDVRVCGLRSPRACVTQPSTERLRAYEKIDGVMVVDTTPLWCVGRTCPAFIGDHLVRADSLHITPEAADAASEAFREVLLDVMPR